MTRPPDFPRDSADRQSLERRLPLLIGALLAAVVAIFCVAAYQEMRRASIERALDRLERLVRELAVSSATNSAPRMAALQRLARQPAIRNALRGQDSLAALAAVEALVRDRVLADSTLDGWELWTARGERPLRVGDGGSARDSAVLAALRGGSVHSDSPRRSPLFAVGDRVYSWTAVPVRVDGRWEGFLAERRHLPNSLRTEQTVRALLGGDLTLYFTNVAGAEWSTIRGQAIDAPHPLPPPTGRAVPVRDTLGRNWYAVQAMIAGSPWVLVLSQSESSILQRPREFLLRMIYIGALLLAVGALVAWLLSRHLTRPLRAITDAAAALARGDYSRRVNVVGDAELSQLATTFNAMAAGIADAHDTLARRNAELHHANEAKAKFLAMMSHELRTPLNAIGGYTELMELGLRGPVTPAQVEDLGRIRRSKDHLLSIITDILSFARADAGELPIVLTEIPVRDVLRAAEEVMRPQFDAQEVRFVIDPAPDDLTVRADADKLQQVLLNLLTNALRFTPANGLVRVSVVSDDDVVRIQVRDTGVGIPADQLAAIFEPFVQVDSSLTRRVGGAGLGLAIARELCRAMAGTLEAESVEGRGSVFIVALPNQTATAARAPGSAARARGTTPA